MEIIIDNVTKKYGKKVIIESQSINIDFHNVICLVGESGIGKTTFVNMLLGNDKKFEGNITFCDDLNRVIKTSIMPQSNKLFNNMTVFENIDCFAEVESKDNIITVLEELEILHLRNNFVGELSGGERQRVNLARAVINKPSLCILDEPTANLDNLTTKQLITTLESYCLNKNMSFIIITHDNRIYSKFSNYLKIDNGKILSNKVVIGTKKEKSQFKNSSFIPKKLYKNSVKRNKKNMLLSSIVIIFSMFLFSVGALYIINNANIFSTTVESFYGENGGVIKPVTFIDNPDECTEIPNATVCGNPGEVIIPGYNNFTQEELDYISAYEGIDVFLVDYNYSSAAKGLTYENSVIDYTKFFDSLDEYEAATGDEIYSENVPFQFTQLRGPISDLEKLGSYAVNPEIFNVIYGEVHELKQNELIIPIEYAKVVANDLGIPVEEVIGKTITLDTLNTTDIIKDETSPSGVTFLTEEETIEYTIAWVYEGEGSMLYLPYVEDQSVYKEDLDAMSDNLLYFSGNDVIIDAKLADATDYLNGILVTLNENSAPQEYIDYINTLLYYNSSYELKMQSIGSGAYSIHYTLLDGYSQEDFATYLANGPEPLSYRYVENKEVLMNNDAYNDNDDRFIMLVLLFIFLILILFLLLKIHFKKVEHELRLARLLGFNNKQVLNVYSRHYLKRISPLILITSAIATIFMIIINIKIVTLYLNICSLIILCTMLLLASFIATIFNYLTITRTNITKEFHE